jgi:hypothetical protein
MRFLVPANLKDDVKAWINARHLTGKKSNWFPFFRMPSTGNSAILVYIEPEDALIFALTFEHEKLDRR